MSKQKQRRNSRRDRDFQFLEEALYNNGAAQLDGRRKKTWSTHDLKTIKALKPAQEDMFHAWHNNPHICAYGTAGTGKTFLALYMALNEVFNASTPQDHIIIVRSVVPTREVGFLPGTLEEKVSVYEQPYRDVCSELVGRCSTYDDMKEAGVIQFVPTSYIRGLTWDNAIVIVDEGQNMSFHEIDSVITRLGDNSRLIFTGDLKQSDLRPTETGMGKFLKISEGMSCFGRVQFNRHDIVRGSLVKSWIIASEDFETPTTVAA